MRNLALHDLTVTSIPTSGGAIRDVALNLDDGTIYAVTEQINGDADIEWEIWRLGGAKDVRAPCAFTTLS
jgi:hypothetical protein